MLREFLIIRARLMRSDGFSKNVNLNIKTTDVELERSKLKEKYQCETVHLTASEVNLIEIEGEY